MNFTNLNVTPIYLVVIHIKTESDLRLLGRFKNLSFFFFMLLKLLINEFGFRLNLTETLHGFFDKNLCDKQGEK